MSLAYNVDEMCHWHGNSTQLHWSQPLIVTLTTYCMPQMSRETHCPSSLHPLCLIQSWQKLLHFHTWVPLKYPTLWGSSLILQAFVWQITGEINCGHQNETSNFWSRFKNSFNNCIGRRLATYRSTKDALVGWPFAWLLNLTTLASTQNYQNDSSSQSTRRPTVDTASCRLSLTSWM